MESNSEIKDNTLKELLKKVEQPVTSDDFTMLVMQDIKAYETKKANSTNYIKRAWILIALVIVISPFALMYISNLTCNNAYNLAKLIPNICQIIQFLFLAIFSTVILYQFNTLLSFTKKQNVAQTG